MAGWLQNFIVTMILGWYYRKVYKHVWGGQVRKKNAIEVMDYIICQVSKVQGLDKDQVSKIYLFYGSFLYNEEIASSNMCHVYKKKSETNFWD